MPLPPNFLDELRARTTLSEVVGRRVRLSRSNREWKGLCPFHKEKTPSFTVNDQKGFYHCFGCGAHGDAISFLTNHDNLSFMEAVEQLASQTGLDVPKATPEEHARFERQRSLYDLTESACRFFEGQLTRSAGRAARDYLVRRGLDDEAIGRFRLGFAPPDGQALVAFLKGEGFEEKDIIEVGLARRPDDGRAPYAFFRNRVMFPVADRRGRVVAFGARLMEGDGPKYVNSPDGPLFHKGQLLYGLARARLAAAQGHSVIVAEGYMDVIALVRAGFEAAVAPLGTALTEAQIEELWKLAPVPVLCFDGDDAGKRAAVRAVDRILPLLRPDHSARVAFLPRGEDPDSLIQTGGGGAMRSVLGGAVPLADVLFDHQVGAHNLRTPEGRAGLKAALDGQAKRIADRTVQGFYIRHFREKVDEAFPWRRPSGGRFERQGRGAPDRPPGPRPRRPAANTDGPFGPMVLLAVMINHPALFDEIFSELGPVAMADPGLDALKQATVAALSGQSELDSQTLRL
ncbi:MAG TPA: DNA primase, partial [Alphaproteobacteria bacterium]|nr:DNA primase [Alphaproteobacteria bacterium]